MQRHNRLIIFLFVSRILGAAFRLYLVAIVLQEFLFSEMGLPFEVTVIISVFLIWIYTHKGGIKTIIITDTLQTLFMMAAVIFAISSILQSLNLSLVEYLQSPAFDNYNQLFIFDSLLSKSHFIKSFVGVDVYHNLYDGIRSRHDAKKPEL